MIKFKAAIVVEIKLDLWIELTRASKNLLINIQHVTGGSGTSVSYWKIRIDFQINIRNLS